MIQFKKIQSKVEIIYSADLIRVVPATYNVGFSVTDNLIVLSTELKSGSELLDFTVLEIDGRPNDNAADVAEWLVTEFFNKALPGDSSGGSPSGDFLDKNTDSDQEVMSPVTFRSDITVPTNSIILGEDGARLSSAGRAMHFTDARDTPTLFPEYHYDNTGSETPHYWEWGPLQTNFAVNPADDGTIISVADLAFVGALGASATLAIYLKPVSMGDLRIQIWEGSDDQGPVLLDISFTQSFGVMNTIQRFEFPVPIITEPGDLQFVRLSGVDLSGAIQTVGAFPGELQPFMEFDVQLLTQKDLLTEDYVSGGGDMTKAVYDPNTVEGDSFDMDNMVDGSIGKVFTATDQTTLSGAEQTSNKGVINGYAPLDGTGHVPAANLPSYVDSVEEYANLASFPGTGEIGKIYIAIDTNLTYRWSGSIYVELTDTTAIWGGVSGTLSNQTDLKSALDGKAAASHTHTASEVTDFDTEVANNSAVAANTSKISYPGPQDISGKQDILSEGAFVDGDKTKLDNQSGTNTGDQDISGKADRVGDSLTSTTVNGVNLQTNQGVFKFLDGNGNYNAAGGQPYAELYADVLGTQKLMDVDEVINFSASGSSYFLINNVANNTIEISHDGNYNIQYQGSAIMKRDFRYSFWIRVNGLIREDLGCVENGEDNICNPFSFGRILSLLDGDLVEIIGQCDSSGVDKDWKHQLGARFFIIKV